MIARRLSGSLFALASTLAAVGCSRGLDDLPREPVAGTVTMDGLPLSEAVIQFYPTGDASNGPTAGANAEIKDGQFTIPREDGPVPGKYKVSISHAELKDYKPKARGRAKVEVNTSIPNRIKKIGPELIPARYNAQSELAAEIKPGGVSDLKFELKSK
jgi:hypothetical protein